MIQFVWQKLLHKKWLNISTLLGIILLISVVAGSMLYKGAALNRLLQNKFDDYIGEQNAYPAVVKTEYLMEYQNGEDAIEAATQICEKVRTKIQESVPIQTEEEIMFLSSDSMFAVPQYRNDSVTQDRFMMVGTLEKMEYHVAMLKGEIFSEEADEEGIYDCIINENMVYTYNLTVGEVISFPKTEMKNGEELKVRVAGIFKESDSHDSYWVRFPNSYEKMLFVSEQALNEIMQNRASETANMTLLYDVLFHYEEMNYKQVQSVLEGGQALISDAPVVKMQIASDFVGILEGYAEAQKQVESVMQTLQIPLLVLLLVFLYMVSTNIFEMEKNEIAMLKSRGVSNKQIVGSYLLQAIFLTGAGSIIGVPLGWLFAVLLGNADAFMEFSSGRLRDGMMMPDVEFLVSVLVAGLAAILFMTIPALRYTALSVVEVKHKRGTAEKPFWQKYYLDVVILGFALYIRYSMMKQQDILAQQILRGESVDPILFLSSVLFILGCGMVFFRVLQAIIRLVYKMGKRRWKPASYVSFLQIIRNAKKMNFISIFLILTIAMGIFYANTARSMNTNMEERIRYDNGAGLVSTESWKNNLAFAKKNKKVVTYEEPNYLIYEELLKQGTESESSSIRGMTRVIQNNNTKLYYGNYAFEGVQLMGIHTKEFGETAWMKDNVLDKHWYYYLNEISQEPTGVLVSSNFRDKQGAQIGDTIKYAIYDELGNSRALATATICGFVDAWPNYSPYCGEETAEGSISYRDNYLIVANYSTVTSTFGMIPYEIWYEADANAEVIREFAEEKGIELVDVTSVRDDILRNKSDAQIQATNGLLTISFLVILILCAVGFLIYWVMEIRKRELMLGIYRAMGMSMKEVKFMLVHEQILASLTAVAAGIVVGFITSYLYIPLIMTVYLPKKHALDFAVVSIPVDMIRIALVVAVMIGVCFAVLARVVSGMKVAQALKLGED